MSKKQESLQDLQEEIRKLKAGISELERAHRGNAPDLLEAIADSSKDLIAAQDKNFRYLAFNSAYQRETKRVFGADIRIGTSMVEALSHLPEDQEKAVALWGRALRGEAFTVTEEFRGIGEPKYFEGHWHPLLGKGGEIVGASHIVREVTERVRAERALRHSEEEFRAFFENAAVGAVQLGQDGRFLRVNDRFCRITGYSREELLRITPFDITHPDDRERDREGFSALMRGDRPDYKGEKRYVRKDGRPIWVQLTAVMVRELKDSPQRSSAIVQDISDRKSAEMQLRTLAAVVESSGDFIGLATPEMKPFFLNEAGRRMVGLTEAEVAQTEILDYIWPEDRPFVESQVLPDLLRQGRWSSEIRFRHFKTGCPIHVQWNVFQIRNPAGELIAWATVSPDISIRKHMEEELRGARDAAEEASRAKSEFLASMSHEIRTPMTVFLAALDHLLQIDKDPDRRELLELAENSAQRLHSLIDDILDFSRIEARRMSLQEAPFDFSDWLRKTVWMFSIPARDKGLQLDIEIAPEVPPIMVGDPDRLGQILINLLNNAIKFTHKGGVTVSAAVHDRLLRLSVSDTGIGIPEEKRHMLFETFCQLDAFSTRKYGGTGLGLAICQGLAELMDGTIEMQPREGGGSIFSLSIPLKTCSPEFLSRTSDEQEIESFLEFSNARVLLVEDDIQVQSMLRSLLKRKGCQVEVVSSGSQALAKWHRETFDLILMDIQIPDLDGLETARRIRSMEKKEERRRTPIVGLTAHARSELRTRCMEAGMDDFLTKPVRLSEIWAAMHRHISPAAVRSKK